MGITFNSNQDSIMKSYTVGFHVSAQNKFNHPSFLFNLCVVYSANSTIPIFGLKFHTKIHLRHASMGVPTVLWLY